MYDFEYKCLCTQLHIWFWLHLSKHGTSQWVLILKRTFLGLTTRPAELRSLRQEIKNLYFLPRTTWGALEIKSHYGKWETCVEKSNNASQKTHLLRASLSPKLFVQSEKKKEENKRSLDFTLLTCKIMWLNQMTALTAEAVKHQIPYPQSKESWQPYSPQYWKSAKF